MNASDAHRTVETIWKMESAKIIATLVRIVGEITLAEDIAHDALVVALERWPQSGIPEKPGAWLTTVAKRRALDYIRRSKMKQRKIEELSREIPMQHELDVDMSLDDDVSDDLLRLIFMTCHPVLSRDAQVALTLRVVGGLSTAEIAQAYLLAESTIAQRIVRAKRTLSVSRVPFEMPEKEQLSERLSAVLEVIYLMFNEGYSATSGTHWIRPVLCEEALRIGRILAGILPKEREVLGLTALMEIQSSRLKARVSASGEPVLLLEQNRAHWDHLLIRRGLDALERIEQLGGVLGPYALQASIAACHARARTASETNWHRIAALYDALSQCAPSPIVELNRAVALSMAFGPALGLDIVDELRKEPSLQHYYLLPSVRGDFLFKLGRKAEASEEFKRAAALTNNERERELLLKRAIACHEEG